MYKSLPRPAQVNTFNWLATLTQWDFTPAQSAWGVTYKRMYLTHWAGPTLSKVHRVRGWYPYTGKPPASLYHVDTHPGWVSSFSEVVKTRRTYPTPGVFRRTKRVTQRCRWRLRRRGLPLPARQKRFIQTRRFRMYRGSLTYRGGTKVDHPRRLHLWEYPRGQFNRYKLTGYHLQRKPWWRWRVTRYVPRLWHAPVVPRRIRRVGLFRVWLRGLHLGGGFRFAPFVGFKNFSRAVVQYTRGGHPRWISQRGWQSISGGTNQPGRIPRLSRWYQRYRRVRPRGRTKQYQFFTLLGLAGIPTYGLGLHRVRPAGLPTRLAKLVDLPGRVDFLNRKTRHLSRYTPTFGATRLVSWATPRKVTPPAGATGILPWRRTRRVHHRVVKGYPTRPHRGRRWRFTQARRGRPRRKKLNLLELVGPSRRFFPASREKQLFFVKSKKRWVLHRQKRKYRTRRIRRRPWWWVRPVNRAHIKVATWVLRRLLLGYNFGVPRRRRRWVVKPVYLWRRNLRRKRRFLLTRVGWLGLTKFIRFRPNRRRRLRYRPIRRARHARQTRKLRFHPRRKVARLRGRPRIWLSRKRTKNFMNQIRFLLRRRRPRRRKQPRRATQRGRIRLKFTWTGEVHPRGRIRRVQRGRRRTVRGVRPKRFQLKGPRRVVPRRALLGRMWNLFFRDGKKTQSERLERTVTVWYKRRRRTPLELYYKFFTVLGVRSKRRGGVAVKIPTTVHPGKSLSRTRRWIKEATLKRGERSWWARAQGELCGPNRSLKQRTTFIKSVYTNVAFL